MGHPSDPRQYAYSDGETLGVGGFGKVVRAIRNSDKKTFAKKILTDNTPAARRNFASEVRALSKLAHPKIIRVEDSCLDGGVCYYTMPLYTCSLSVYRISTRFWTTADASKVIRGICEGISYAHQQGVLHRDLKPHNILMNSIDDFVISDFGLCRIEDPNLTRNTQTGDQMGSYGYSAPEQFVDAKRADFRSDIFALGKIFLFLHTGLHPYQSADINSIPAHAAIIVDRCTRFNPKDRFQSVGEMMSAIASLEKSATSLDAPQQLQKIIGEMEARGTASLDEIEGLAACIRILQTDSTTLHDVVVSLPSGVIGELHAFDPAAAEIAIHQFSKVALETSWPFSYTDRIAAACRKITHEVRSEHLRGTMAAITLIIGVNHNRWGVIDAGKAMLLDCTSNESALDAAKLLRENNINLADVYAEETPSLNPILRESMLIREL